MVQSSAGGRDAVDFVLRAFAYIQQVNAARNISRIKVRVRRSMVFIGLSLSKSRRPFLSYTLHGFEENSS